MSSNSIGDGTEAIKVIEGLGIKRAKELAGMDLLCVMMLLTRGWT